MEIINTVGRRKTAVARVFVKEGNGNFSINKKEGKVYFPTMTLQYVINQAFNVTDTASKYDITATIRGGGISGQAEALRLGIARALCKINPELRPALKAKGLLTRNPKMVERKKAGQKKARKRFQFSKR